MEPKAKKRKVKGASDESEVSSGMESSEDTKEETRKERNRRHARETRLRKKKFIDDLKSELAQAKSDKASLEAKVILPDRLHMCVCVWW